MKSNLLIAETNKIQKSSRKLITSSTMFQLENLRSKKQKEQAGLKKGN